MIPARGRSLPRDRQWMAGAGWALRASSRFSVSCFVAGTLAASATSAQTPVTTPSATATEVAAAESPRVEVNLVGPVGTDPVLRQLLEEWLGANEIDYVIARPDRLRAQDVKSPRSDGPPVRMWIVAVGGDRARLYFAEPDSSRYLVRELPVPSGFDEVGRERIVQIVLSSALAFIEEGASSTLEEVERSMTDVAEEPPMTTQPAPAKVESVESPLAAPPASAPLPPPRHRTEVGIGIGYGVTTQGRAGIPHGPGLRLSLARTTDEFGVSFMLLGQYRPVRSVRADRVRLELADGILVGGLGVEVGMTGSVLWQTYVGGGLRLVDVVPHPRTTDVLVAGRSRTARGLGFIGFGPRWRRGRACLALQVRLDVEPVGVRYELESAGERVAQVSVPQLQPGLFLDVGWRRSVAGARATP